MKSRITPNELCVEMVLDRDHPVGLKDRGTLAKQKIADLFVFDPETNVFPSPAESDVNDSFPVAKVFLRSL
jgi:N-acyl-D-aspartate/D-glutamate deacylase